MADSATTPEIEVLLGRPRENIFKGRVRFLAIAALALSVLFIVSRCAGGPPAPVFLTEVVKRGDLTVTVTATGNLAPTNQIDVGSETSGIVERVLVDVNDAVKRDQPLAVLDASRLRDAVASAQATLAANEATIVQAQATLDESRAQLVRLESVNQLSGGRAPAQTELASQRAAVKRAEANLRSAQANAVAARAQLSSSQTQAAKAVIRSPVSGVVLKRSIDPGQTVQAAFNTPSMFIIAEDLTHMKLEVAVDEADVGLVKEGMAAQFSVDAYPGQSFPATITRVSLGARNLTSGGAGATANISNVVSYLTNLSLANADLKLRPGMTATATIRVETARNVLVAPNAALRFSPPRRSSSPKNAFAIKPPDARQTEAVQERGIGSGSRQSVYVRKADGTLRAVAVVTGQSDGRNTVVTPLNPGDLQPGMAVVTGLKAMDRP